VRAQFRSERALLSRANDAADVTQALDGIDDDWTALCGDAWTMVGRDGADWLYADFDDSGADDALLTAAILAALAARGRSISDTTRARLVAALEAGSNAQADIGALYDHWTGDDDSDTEPRADALAWDLTVGAWAAGLLLAGGQAEADGHTVTRTWVSVGDRRVRPSHADADGQSVGLDEAYNVGGEDLMYPGDPSGSEAETAGCRCGEDYEIV
jgi:hypothetical protein